MAYTTPTTRASGAVITESIWNTDLVDNITYLKTERDIAVQALPVGHMLIWPTTTAPAKFLLCDGAFVSRTAYAALFAVIGTQFGNSGDPNTFALPDMRGRFPLGLDNMGYWGSANRVTAAAADVMGGSGGAETHTLATTELPSHTHGIPANSGANVSTTNVARSGGEDTDFNVNSVAAGGGGAHNNMPPYLAINFIIYAGV